MASPIIVTSVPIHEAAALANVGPGAECILSSMLSEFLWFAGGAVTVYILMLLGVIPEWRGPGLFEFADGIRKERLAQRRCAIKNLCAAASAGQYCSVLEAWGREKKRGILPNDALEDVTQALLALAPERVVPELVEHLTRYPGEYAQPSTINVLLEVVARSGHRESASLLWRSLQQRLGICADARTRAAMEAASAEAGECS